MPSIPQEKRELLQKEHSENDNEFNDLNKDQIEEILTPELNDENVKEKIEIEQISQKKKTNPNKVIYYLFLP